jgi:hypothetical protein
MSHVAAVQLEIKDLNCLALACAKLGLFFREQKTYKWFGQWMQDYSEASAAYRQGIKPEDYGKCDYAIGIPGDSNAYEVGVVKNPNGEGYVLVYDFWEGGFGLEEKIGKESQLLKQRYSAEVARKHAIRKGYKVRETTTADGKIILKASR